ncbi:MAG: hypothetical protein H0U66_17345 [Gemmatimonadaceae bacterium]|nr:hypothetical protein [Gemmatimonadaceae bacterium]
MRTRSRSWIITPWRSKIERISLGAKPPISSSTGTSTLDASSLITVRLAIRVICRVSLTAIVRPSP